MFEKYFHIRTRLIPRLSQHLYVIIGDECFLACSIVARKLELVANNLILELAVEISCA